MMARCVYGLLQVAFPLFSMWNPLYGSAVAFALMALLVEYIVVGIFFYIGFSTPPDRGVIGMDEEEDAGVKP